MYRVLRLIRNIAAIGLLGLSVSAFIKAFYPLPFFNIQFLSLLERFSVRESLFAGAMLIFFVVLTLLFGRIYCSILCPLGLYQELVRLIFHRQLPYRSNRFLKYVIALVLVGLLLGGTVFITRFFDPYALFGAAMSGAVWGVCLLAGITVLTVFKGRFFCTDICPVGAILGFLSRFALFRVFIDEAKCRTCGKCAKVCPSGCIDYKNHFVNNELCVRCSACLKVCPFQAMRFGKKSPPPVAFNSKRREFLLGALSLAVVGAAYKSGLIWVQKTTHRFKNIIVPPGGESPDAFVNRCLNCNLCVQNCPMKVLKKATAAYPAVHVEYDNSFCSDSCHRCSQICPSGALKRLSLAQKRQTKIGTADINAEICINCGLCAMECPRGAIVQEATVSRVQREKCIGCGACKAVCPVQAILVNGVEKQISV